MGLWAWRNFRGVAAAAVMPLALALAGCEEDVETTLQASQSEAPENVLESEQSKAEKFTTEGKPTKTIKTPWGPREIYDPLKDVKVQVAFKEIYSQNNSQFKLKYCCEQESYKGSARTLYRAMMKQIDSYKGLSCQTITTSQCGTWYTRRCETTQRCHYRFAEANGGYFCSVGSERSHDISRFPIGELSKVQMPNKNYEEQLKNLFLVHCQAYGE